ncbi:hypothetical protein [Amantichitinum ursilacus]|nr:hypothetical protein [Amantichitinum ursilacus]
MVNELLQRPLFLIYIVLIVFAWWVQARLISALRRKHHDLFVALGSPGIENASWSASQKALSAFIWRLRFFQVKDGEVRFYCVTLILITIYALAFLMWTWF